MPKSDLEVNAFRKYISKDFFSANINALSIFENGFIETFKIKMRKHDQTGWCRGT